MQQQLEKPEMQNRRLELESQAKPNNTPRMMGMGPGLTHHEVVGRVIWPVLNRTKLFLWSHPGMLAGYLQPLLTQVFPILTLLKFNSRYIIMISHIQLEKPQSSIIKLQQIELSIPHNVLYMPLVSALPPLHQLWNQKHSTLYPSTQSKFGKGNILN